MGSRNLQNIMVQSSDGAVHHEVHRGASWEFPDGALLDRCVDFDLSHVCVSAVLMVRQHRDLDHEGADRIVRTLRQNNDKYVRYNVLSSGYRLVGGEAGR